jgi:hypothetical protein
MSTDKIVFEAEDLSKLEPGKVFISAPALDDVLQINVKKQNEIVPLDITVGNGSINVKRVDEKPLQVVIIGSFFDNHENASHRIFRRPQPEIQFAHVDGPMWQIENDQDIIGDGFRIGVFADVISIYGVQKQRRQRRQLTQRFYEHIEALSNTQLLDEYYTTTKQHGRSHGDLTEPRSFEKP